MVNFTIDGKDNIMYYVRVCVCVCVVMVTSLLSHTFSWLMCQSETAKVFVK